MKEVISTTESEVIKKFRFHDGDHKPSWRNYGTGTAQLTVISHVKNRYLSFVSLEYSCETKSMKETHVTMDEAEGRKLYAWLRELYESESAAIQIRA